MLLGSFLMDIGLLLKYNNLPWRCCLSWFISSIGETLFEAGWRRVRRAMQADINKRKISD